MAVLSKAVGHSSAALALPARKLVDTGRVKKTGQNATTRYFPVGRQPVNVGIDDAKAAVDYAPASNDGLAAGLLLVASGVR